MSAQILDVEDDFLDPQLRDIEENIRLSRRPVAMAMPAGVAPSLGPFAGTQDVVVHAWPSRALGMCAPLRVGIGQPGRRSLWDGRLTRKSATESRKRLRQARRHPNQFWPPCTDQPHAYRRNGNRGTD